VGFLDCDVFRRRRLRSESDTFARAVRDAAAQTIDGDED